MKTKEDHESLALSKCSEKDNCFSLSIVSKFVSQTMVWQRATYYSLRGKSTEAHPLHISYVCFLITKTELSSYNSSCI